MSESKEFGPGHPEYEEAKKEIVKEGWEGDKEGGAAIVIGKDPERQQQRARLEQEGPAENLETYIKLHSEVAAPSEFVDAYMGKNRGSLSSQGIDTSGFSDPGSYTLQKVEYLLDSTSFRPPQSLRLLYISKNGELKNVKLDPGITSSLGSSLKSELADLGFRQFSPTYGEVLLDIEYEYQAKIQQEIKDKKSKEFDF